MRTHIRMVTMAMAMAMLNAVASAQWLNPGGAGDFHLDPALTPGSVTVGSATIPDAALSVRADLLVTPPTTPAGGGGTWFDLFRTTVPIGNNGRWQAFRDNINMGSIYTTAQGQGFHIQAVQGNDPPPLNPGILWLENNDRDGFMLRANGGQNPLNGFPLQLDGFASLGIRTLGTNGMPSRARFQLVDNDAVAVVEPWRPYFRNGVLFTGNNDMGYIGHVYHDASGGTTPWSYTLDRSDLVISAGEDDLTDPLRQRIRFTYTTTPGTAGSAGTYNGLEFMQLWPETSNEGFVGIGDFTLAAVNPAERLDVLDRTIRLRGLPTATYQLTGGDWDRVMVVRADGTVNWRSATTIGGGACTYLMC